MRKSSFNSVFWLFGTGYDAHVNGPRTLPELKESAKCYRRAAELEPVQKTKDEGLCLAAEIDQLVEAMEAEEAKAKAEEAKAAAAARAAEEAKANAAAEELLAEEAAEKEAAEKKAAQAKGGKAKAKGKKGKR